MITIKSQQRKEEAPRAKEWKELSDNSRTTELKPFGIKGEDLMRALKRLALEAIHALFKEYEKAYKRGDWLTKQNITDELLYKDHRIVMLTNGAMKGETLLCAFEEKCKTMYGKFVRTY